VPPTIKTSVKVLTLRSSILVSFQQITFMVFKLGNFTNLEAFFPVVSTDFPYDLSMSKVE